MNAPSPAPARPTSTSRYWRLVALAAAGTRQLHPLPKLKAFLQQVLSDGDSDGEAPSDSQIQAQLLAARDGKPTGDRLASGCLRCCISWHIDATCQQLATRFGTRHGFRADDLRPFVLDDEPRSLQADLDARPARPYRPLAVEILDSFDRERSSLSTWTARKVKHHGDLNGFLLQQGVYLVSDWAILNDTRPRQLDRILGAVGDWGAAEVDAARTLLAAYHAVYRAERRQARAVGAAAGRCQPPSDDQLRRMAARLPGSPPPNRLLAELQSLAGALRQYRIRARGGAVDVESLEARYAEGRHWTECLAAPPSDAEEESTPRDGFLDFYRDLFVVRLQEAMVAAIADRVARLRRRDAPKADRFLEALQRFHCTGESMGQIAQAIDLKAQYQVTRLLDLKALRAAVRRTLVSLLAADIRREWGDRLPPDGLAALDAALDEQLEALIQEAETEASTPGGAVPSSAFARAVCRALAAGAGRA